MSLDEDIIKLDSIVKRIESEILPIDDTISLYEEAILLSQKCLSFISMQKGRLTELTKTLEKLEIEDDA